MKRHPDFIFIGPDKSGSTWIHRVLQWHPEVFVAESKELEFFNNYYGRGLDWYLAYFREAGPGHGAVGEVCHDYLFSEAACERIHRHFPRLRLLVCLREPVERAFSAYLYMIRQGRVSGSFEDALEAMDELVDHGRYARHLAPYLERFGRERVFPGLFDDLQADPAAFAESLFAFLGVSPLAIPEELRGRQLPAARPRSPAAAKAAKRMALLLRGLGFPRLVTRIKSLPLVQHALYREYTPDTRPVPDEATVRALKARLAPEVRRLDEWFGLDLTRRWGYEGY